MSQALRELLPVLLAFYLLDGLTWVRPGHFLLVDRGGYGFRFVGSGLRLAFAPWELTLASTRPMLGLTTAGIHWLERPTAVGAARLTPESWSFLAWEALDQVSAEDRKLHLRGGTSVAAIPLATASDSHHWHQRISTLQQLPAAERGRVLTEMETEASDLQALTAQHRRLRPALDRLAALSLLLATGLFVGLPLTLLLASPRFLTQALTSLLLGCLAAQVLVAFFALRMARTLRREGSTLPFSLLLSLALYPPASMHAASHLSRHSHPFFDGLALLAVFLEPEALSTHARTELWSVRQALTQTQGEGEGWRELWGRRRRLIQRVLEQGGLDEGTVLAPPPRRDPAAALFCGLCDSEYLPGTERCPQCDLPLVSL